MSEQKNKPITVIKPKNKFFDLRLGELADYSNLIRMFVKRNIVTKYKQTILGPLWLIITPILSTLVSTFVFGTIAKIDSGSVPYFLFYFVGSALWAYFAACVISTSSTFYANARVFGKVYFPRITVPISVIISNLLSFAVQFLLAILFMIYFSFRGFAITPEWKDLWVLPLLVFEVAVLALGVGLILSSITAKYRDLSNVITLGIDLWKYVTPVIYGVSTVTFSNKVRTLCMLNPVSPVIEAFRYFLLGNGAGVLDMGYLLISVVETAVLLLFGVLIFNKVERTFADTV